jgi:hypothetical protein
MRGTASGKLRAAACAWMVLAALPIAATAEGSAAAAPARAASSASGIPGNVPLKRELSGATAATNWPVTILLLGLTGAASAALLVVRRGGTRWWQGAGALRKQPGAIAPLGRQVLTPQVSVHAVRWHGEDLLLSCTAHEVTVLARHASADAEEQA